MNCSSSLTVWKLGFGSLTATNRAALCRGAPIEGEALAPASLPQLQVVLQGLLDKRRLLDFNPLFCGL